MPPGTVLLSSRAPIGYLAIAANEICTNQGFKSIVPDSKVVNSEYLYYYLKCHIDEIRDLGSGTTFAEISGKTLENYEIILPEISVQCEIASFLSSLDCKIELNQLINDNLLLQKQTAFKQLMLTVSNSDLTTLESVAKLQKQTWKPSECSEILEHYSIPAFDEKKYPSFDVSTTIQSNKTIVTADCILVSKLNPETKRVWRPICITDKAVCSTEFLAIIPKKKEYAQYVYSIIDSDEFTEYLINNATGTTGSRQRVLPGTAMLFELPLPQISVIKDYSNLSESIENKIKNNLLEIQKLTELRNYLLPKLMSGEMDVSTLEIPN